MSEHDEKPAINYVQSASPATRVWRLETVSEITGVEPGTIKDLVINHDFPKPIKIGRSQGRAVGWVSDEVMTWINQRIELRNQRIQSSKGNAAVANFQQPTS